VLLYLLDKFLLPGPATALIKSQVSVHTEDHVHSSVIYKSRIIQLTCKDNKRQTELAFMPYNVRDESK